MVWYSPVILSLLLLRHGLPSRPSSLHAPFSWVISEFPACGFAPLFERSSLLASFLSLCAGYSFLFRRRYRPPMTFFSRFGCFFFRRLNPATLLSKFFDGLSLPCPVPNSLLNAAGRLTLPFTRFFSPLLARSHFPFVKDP